MRADNSHHLIDAARRRSQATRRRAVAAYVAWTTAGRPSPSTPSPARRASPGHGSTANPTSGPRRTAARPPATRPADAVPDRQRASDASLLRRLEVATQRIRELETDNKRLRHALAEALGERRATNARDPSATRRHHELPTARPTPERHVSDTVHDANQQVTAMIVPAGSR